jgi:hypothetical protein
MTSILQPGTLGSVASLLATTLYQENSDKKSELLNIVSTGSSAQFIMHRVAINPPRLIIVDYFLGSGIKVVNDFYQIWAPLDILSLFFYILYERYYYK